MGVAQAFLGDVVSIVIFVMLVAGIMKIFQIAGDLQESKELLKDIKRNTQPSASPYAQNPAGSNEGSAQTPVGPISPEDLVRAVHAQKFSDDEFPALDPIVLPPSFKG